MKRLKIACFICKWAITEDRLALDELRKIADVSVIQMKCIGGIDPPLIFEAFARGVDGISLIGCPPSDCHFIEGCSNAEFMTIILRDLLVLAGLQPERLQLYWSSTLGEDEINSFLFSFAEQIKRTGPLPVSNENILQNLLAAKNVVGDYRLRAWIGKRKEVVDIGNVYGKRIPLKEFRFLLRDVIETEFIRHKILLLTKTRTLSVKELAKLLNIKPPIVLSHILDMRRKGLITLDYVTGTTPLYRATGG